MFCFPQLRHAMTLLLSMLLLLVMLVQYIHEYDRVFSVAAAASIVTRKY